MISVKSIMSRKKSTWHVTGNRERSLPSTHPQFYLSISCSKYLISLPTTLCPAETEIKPNPHFFFKHRRKKENPVRRSPPPPAARREATLLVLLFPPVRHALLPDDEHKHRQHHMQPHHRDNGRVKATVIRGH